MPLRFYKNKETGEVKRSLKPLPHDCWEEVITAPNQKFMELRDPEKGKSIERGLKAVLTERARNHSRDVDLDDTIQTNLSNGLTEKVATNLLNSKGERRKKVDDL